MKNDKYTEIYEKYLLEFGDDYAKNWDKYNKNEQIEIMTKCIEKGEDAVSLGYCQPWNCCPELF